MGEKGGACEAAERAWKDARASVGKDHVLETTLAFIKKWPGVEDGNPCAVAGTDYVKEILAGNSHDDATSAAMRAFIRAFKQRANKGATLNDEACHKASRAFFDAVPQKSDPIIGAGFTASLKAARSFLKAFISNPQKVPADSPCASATL